MSKIISYDKAKKLKDEVSTVKVKEVGNINISVMYNDNLKIFYDQKDIDNAIKNTMATNPAKVVILYDLMGNIINPGKIDYI